jgi:hypothetical protein
MDTLILLNRYLHIIVGFIGIGLWWVPIFTAKGAVTHKRIGKMFVAAAYVVGATAMLSAPLRFSAGFLGGVSWEAMRPQAGFLILLGYLGILTFDLAYFGVRVLRTRRNPERLAAVPMRAVTWLMMGWSVLSALFAVIVWTPSSMIMLGFAPVGVLQGIEQIRYMRRPPSLNKPWFYAHMDAMLGAGVGFHTAFLVFGSRMLFDYSMLGPFNWVPWVAPAIVGAIAGRAWRRQYMRAFGDLPGADAARV